jgi:hypothetical protein
MLVYDESGLEAGLFDRPDKTAFFDDERISDYLSVPVAGHRQSSGLGVNEGRPHLLKRPPADSTYFIPMQLA